MYEFCLNYIGDYRFSIRLVKKYAFPIFLDNQLLKYELNLKEFKI